MTPSRGSSRKRKVSPVADDSDNETPDGAPNVEVNVTLPDDAPPATDDGVTAVVVNTGESAVESGETDRWVELERWKVETEQSIRTAMDEAFRAQSEAAEARWAAQDARDSGVADAVASAELVAELADEVEEVEELVEDEIAPASTKIHPVFRPFRSWFPKRED